MNKEIYNFLYGINCLHLDLMKKMQLFILRKKWRRSNRYNYRSAENNDFPLDRVTVRDKTHGPLIVYSFENIPDSKLKGPIVIEDDVWIGFCSIILSGVKLSKGTVVGAGFVVTK